MANAEKYWYVLRAIGGKEKKAKENLDAEVKRRGLEDLVGEAIVPVEHIYTQKNGKKVVKERVLLGGYVFVEAALVGEVAAVITQVPNIIDFLRDKDNKPAKLRQNEIDRMIGKVDESVENEAVVEVPFLVGETVKVIDGPFNGFSGEIESIDESKKMLSVLVKIFGRKNALELGYFQVEKEQ